jgi:hypothetical protein
MIKPFIIELILLHVYSVVYPAFTKAKNMKVKCYEVLSLEGIVRGNKRRLLCKVIEPR